MFSKKLIVAVVLFLLSIALYFSGFFEETVVKGKVVSNSRLKKVVEKIMADSQGRYAIAIKNFKTGETYYSKEHEVFESGSLYKLWVMASVFQNLKEGKIKEDDILSEEVSVLNNQFRIEEGLAEFTQGSITLTVSQALQQMITISHNYATLLLANVVGTNSIFKLIDDLALKDSSFSNPPKTTAFDTALLLEKLYSGQVVDQESSKKMVELLKKQRLNNGLPKLLPKEAVVAHKTGDIGWFKHDVGLVYAPRGDYLIVILSESDYPSEAQEKIALLSKAVFVHFEDE